jgi:hypothetical protein
MHKLILAIVAILLVGAIALFALNRTSHAPEKVLTDPPGRTINEQSSVGDESKIVDLTYCLLADGETVSMGEGIVGAIRGRILVHGGPIRS